MPCWDDWRYLLTVVRTGSQSAAARALGVSQPTVSRRLEQLEEAVGLRLLVRVEGRLEPTEAGRELIRFMEGIEREAEAIDRVLARHRAGSGRPVRLATTRGLALFLAPTIASLDPELRARLVVHVDLGLADLAHDQADVALRMGRPGDEDLRGRRLGPVHCGLYGSRRWLDRVGRPETPEQLGSLPEIRSVGPLAGLQQVRALAAVGSLAPGPGADCVAVQIAMAVAGCGVGAFPCFMAAREPELERILVDVLDVPVELWALTHPDRSRDPAVRAVFEAVVDAAERGRDQLLGRAGEEPADRAQDGESSRFSGA